MPIYTAYTTRVGPTNNPFAGRIRFCRPKLYIILH